MAHRMTPARRAALKKAQAASARKRRGKGKGKLAAANRAQGGSVRRHLNRHGAKYAVGLVAAAYVGAHVAGRHIAKRDLARKRDHASAVNKARYANIADNNKRSSFKKKTRPHVRTMGKSKHNRSFVTSRHGTTSVRTHY